MSHSVPTILNGCSLAVVGCFGVALAYRAGVLQHVLPSAVYTSLVNKVESIKSRTEPLSGSAQYVVARRHLLTTYAYTAIGFALGGAGIGLFFKYPHFPIGPTIIAAAVPAMGLQIFPKKWLLPKGRVALFGLACVACGYSLGPMHWVAFDSMCTVGIVIGCTLTGACLPLFLTRGIISYFFAAQALSCSLAVVTGDWSTTRTVDINIVLLMQLVGNVALGFLHTVPTIKTCITWTDSLEALEEKKLDPVLEALHICANVSYGCWYAFRVICTTLLWRITREDVKGTTKQEQSHLGRFARTTLNIDRWSNALASFFFLVAYVRVVSYLQQRGQEMPKQLEQLRLLFRKVSPFTAFA
jgi:hypothetical protein